MWFSWRVVWRGGGSVAWGKRARSTQAVSVPGDPAGEHAAGGMETGQLEQDADGPEPPHPEEQGAPGIDPAQGPAIGELEPHGGPKLVVRDPQLFRRPRCLQGKPDQAASLEDASPAPLLGDAEPAPGIEVDPAGRARVVRCGNFCIHGNQRATKASRTAGNVREATRPAPPIGQLPRPVSARWCRFDGPVTMDERGNCLGAGLSAAGLAVISVYSEIIASLA